MTDHIAVTGNITSVPERVDIGNGVVVAKFGLACTERRQRDGAWVDVHTNFYNVSVYRRLAEHVLASLTQGQRIVVIGALKVRKWDNGTSHGIAVDLEASSIGPDLLFGTAQFRADRPAEAGDRPVPATEAAAPAVPRTDAHGWALPDTSPAPSVAAPAGALVGATAGSGAVDDETPF